MKTITIPSTYINTIMGFIEWFKADYEINEKDLQYAIRTLSQKCELQNDFEIQDLEIWFLRNYLQSAWQDVACLAVVESEKLHELYDYIKDNDDRLARIR